MSSFSFENRSFWDSLPRREKPVVLYGTGNGADKILDLLEARGIDADGVFASDGFVRDRCFRGMKVMSYSDAVRCFGNDMTVLMAFGSNRPEVIQTAELLDEKHDLIIPEVPLYGGCLFDYSHFLDVYDRIERLSDSLADETSRAILYDLVNFRLTGKLKYLRRTQSLSDSMKELIHTDEIRSCFDGGAYKGDTLRGMMDSFPHLTQVYCVEPDPASFRQLKEFSESRKNIIINLHNVVLSDARGSVGFSSSAGRGAGVRSTSRRASSVTIAADTVDSILDGSSVDYIKLDVEGDEADALRGASDTIRSFRPCLSVSVYHRTDDFLSIPDLIRTLYPGYRLYFRRQNCIPMWDLDLFAVPGT